MKWVLAGTGILALAGIALFVVDQSGLSYWAGSALVVPFMLAVLWFVRDQDWGN